MRNLIVAPTVIGVLLASTLLLPVPQADHDLGPAFFGVFFDDPTITFARPAGETTKAKSIAASPAPGAPGLTPATAVVLTTFGGLAVPAKIVAATDLVASVWLSASYEIPLNQIRMSLQKASGSTTTNIVTLSVGGSNLLRGADGSPHPTLKTVPEQFFLTVPRKDGSGADNIREIEAGSVLTLGIGVLTAGAEGQPVDVKIHYGSARHPSGLTYGVARDVGSLSQGYGAGIYLDSDNALTMTEPTSARTLTRASGNTGNTLSEAPEWAWGSVVVREKFTILSDGIFNVSLQMPTSGTPPVGARLVLQVNLYVGDTKISGSTNYVVGSYVSVEAKPPTPDKVVIGLPTAGVEIPAGSTVTIKLQLFAEQPGGAIEFLYGSAATPSGILFAASSSGAPNLSGGSITAVPGGTSTTTSASVQAEPTTSASVDAGAPQDESSGKKTPALTFILIAVALMLAVTLARRRE